MTEQVAWRPQVPGHGLTHLLLEQARSLSQSVLMMHSGLHPL